MPPPHRRQAAWGLIGDFYSQALPWSGARRVEIAPSGAPMSAPSAGSSTNRMLMTPNKTVNPKYRRRVADVALRWRGEGLLGQRLPDLGS